MSVGGDLRIAREARGMSLLEVSHATRIRATLIGLIEADDWDACGGAVYARGHIRAVAAAIGADAGPLVAEFDAEHGAPGPVVLHDAFEESTGGPRIRERRGPNWLAAAVGAAAVATALIAASVLSSNGRGGTGGGGTAALVPSVPSTGAPSPPAVAAPPAPVVSSSPPLTAQRAPVVVRVRITKAPGSWVLATSPGKSFPTGPKGKVLPAGSTTEFSSDKPIKLVFGNAGAVDITVNGKSAGAPGKDGEVLSVTFDADSGQA